MAEQPKRMILAKGLCGTCQSPVSVEIEEPAPKVEVKREPCKCGKTEFERSIRWLALGFMTLFVTLMGSCITHQYFTTKQIEAVTEKYQHRKARPDDKPFFNMPDYVVEEKLQDEKKPEPAKK